jgi:hypothetical protein
MSLEISQEGYLVSMAKAEDAIHQKDYEAANRLLRQAHGLGHAVKAAQLRAHRQRIRVGMLRHDPLQVLTQSALLVLAWLFD